MAASIAFRFPNEATFEALAGLATPASVSAVRQQVLDRRPAAREALHGKRNLAASGWKVLFTDAADKAEYVDDEVMVPASAQLVVTLVKEYAVRAPSKMSRRTFVGRFPGGKPGLSAAASGSSQWHMSCTAALDAAGQAEATAVPHTLQLHGGAAGAHYTGMPEGGSSSASYYVFTLRAEGVIDAVPSGPWYTFRPTGRAKNAMTLEQAEERMQRLANGGEDHAQGHLLARLRGPASAARPARGAGGSDSDSERMGDDSGEDSDSEGGAPRRRRRRRPAPGGGAAADAGGATRPGGVAFDADDREDWEHERAMATDDDEAVGVDDQIGEEEEPPPPPQMRADADDEQQLDEEARKLQRNLKKQRKLDEQGSDEEESSEDDLSFEDDDFLDPDKDTRLSKLLKGPEEIEPPQRVIKQSSSQPALGAMGGTASQPSPVQAGVKRARSPETQLPAGAGAGAAAAAAPPAKVARVDDGTPASASITKLEADCGITVNDLKAFIPAGGVPMKDISKRFTKNLHTVTAKTAFMELMKRFTRLQDGRIFKK